MRKIIAYYRVSTKRQGLSGLGLEGQQDAVERYAASQGQQVLATYTEVETGKKADRPELAKAIAHAKRAKATLVVAKLDRLARNSNRSRPRGREMRIGLDLGGWFLAQCAYERAKNTYRTAARSRTGA